ncbi:hypothetical protein AXG93_2356s1040 [Marchantia polymorpha subsp. ruderalis]|uniref:Uncharacterized protein n=1 Tax=Marchantia polymorpha subsp. ruderalis TaxID=1480154 RepID=A0A176WDT3_MARPO|nr:hypothetical protein AXG93_2356s1040 [Marchantia polymorpha subsp. ruderalis]
MHGIIIMCQRKYIKKVFKRFNIEDCKSICTPLDVNVKLMKLLLEEFETIEVGKSTQPVEMEEPLGVLIEVPTYAPAKPLKERTEIVSSNSLSSERTRGAGNEEIPHPKTSEELVEELTLSDKILEQESVVPLLKYLDGKREKYVVSKEAEFYVQLVKNRTKLKSAIAVKREWDSTTELARERAANLATECAAMKAALQEREAQLREKEIECEVLQLNLAKESKSCAEFEETCEGLRISNENGQKVTVDLLARLEKSREAYNEAVKRSERLIVTAEKREWNHVEEVAKLEAQRAEEVRIAEEL